MLRKSIPLPLVTMALALGAALLLTSMSTVQATDPFPTKRPLYESQLEVAAQFGYRVAIGDINGDGYRDIVATAPYADVGGVADVGEVKVLLGPCLIKSVTLQISGLDAGANLGWSLAVGNVGGDSKDDIVVGAPLANVPGNTDAGKAFIFYGTSNLVDRTSADVVLDDPDTRTAGFESGGQFGYSVAIGNVGTPSDSSADAANDVIVGSPFRDFHYDHSSTTDVGHVWIFWGPNPSPANPADVFPSNAQNLPSLQFGRAVATGAFDAANPDGTTYADLLAGAPKERVGGVANAGAVYFYQGRKSFPDGLGAEDAKLAASTPTSYAFIGLALALGDVNGDGNQDLLTGAPLYSNNVGRTYLTFGRSSPEGVILADYELLTPTSNWAMNGQAVAVADINGDSYADMFSSAVGAPKKVFVWYGAQPEDFDVELDLTIDQPIVQSGYTYFGYSLAIGDVDFNWGPPQDSQPDLVVGSPLFNVDSGGTVLNDAGAVFAFETDADADSDGINDGCDNCMNVPNADQKNSDSVPVTFTGWSNANLFSGAATVYTDLTIPTSGQANHRFGWDNWDDWTGDACDTGDSDKDGLTDEQETTGSACNGYTSDPTKMNSNGDVNLDIDSWECLSTVPKDVTNPSDASYPPQGTTDADEDALPDILEVQKYGTLTGPDWMGQYSDNDFQTDDREVFDVTGDAAVNGADAWSVCAASKGVAPYNANLDLDKNGAVNSVDMQWMNSYLAAHGGSAIDCQWYN